MKVVCDTNVLVSGFLFRGNPRAILQLISKGRLTGFISIPLLRELEEVLQRPKFNLAQPHVRAILELVQQTFHLVSPKEKLAVVPEDPDDNVMVEAALAAAADCITSGDQHLLRLGVFRTIQIVSPAQFLTSICSW